MIRDTLTATLVSLTLFGTAPLQDEGSLGLNLMAATGDVRRTLAKFLDLYGALKSGGGQFIAAPDALSASACPEEFA